MGFAQKTGREVCEKLKDLIPRHNFMIPVQAAIGGKIIARETIKGFKKDVLTKIHGGGALDRKRKLLEKQKKGKARAKQFGRVEIPQEAFIGVLITGGAGFIAHHIIAHVIKNTDWDIVTLDRLDLSGNLNRLHEILDEFSTEDKKRLKIVFHDLKAEINSQIKNEIGT